MEAMHPWASLAKLQTRCALSDWAELSSHSAPWGAILQICFIWDLYKLTRSLLLDNNPCCSMCLMRETQGMSGWQAGVGGAGNDFYISWETPNDGRHEISGTDQGWSPGDNVSWVTQHMSRAAESREQSQNKKLFVEYFYAQEWQS